MTPQQRAAEALAAGDAFLMAVNASPHYRRGLIAIRDEPDPLAERAAAHAGEKHGHECGECLALVSELAQRARGNL